MDPQEIPLGLDMDGEAADPERFEEHRLSDPRQPDRELGGGSGASLERLDQRVFDGLERGQGRTSCASVRVWKPRLRTTSRRAQRARLVA